MTAATSHLVTTASTWFTTRWPHSHREPHGRRPQPLPAGARRLPSPRADVWRNAWVKGRRLLVNLAKNPVGFDRIIQIVQSTGAKTCAFYINDKDADGHDIS